MLGDVWHKLKHTLLKNKCIKLIKQKKKTNWFKNDLQNLINLLIECSETKIFLCNSCIEGNPKWCEPMFHIHLNCILDNTLIIFSI